jgi:hypothetical protein
MERYNRILAEEFLYARTWHSQAERGTALEVWNPHYNYHTRRTVHTTDNRQHPRRRYASAMSWPHTLS